MAYYWQNAYPEPFSQSSIQQKLGIYMLNAVLLRTAFTHSSYLNENPDTDFECNERLEFLGDRVLGQAVAKCLYDSHLNIAAGIMAQTLSIVVSNKTLARVAREHALGQYMLMGSGVAEGGGRNSATILANLLEAIIGALFESRSYDAAYQFCIKLLDSEVNAAYTKVISAPQKPAKKKVKHNQQPTQKKGKKVAITGKHPKTALQELTWARFKCRPKYIIIKPGGAGSKKIVTVNVHVKGQVRGKGEGKSQKDAEKKAAEAALKALA